MEETTRKKRLTGKISSSFFSRVSIGESGVWEKVQPRTSECGVSARKYDRCDNIYLYPLQFTNSNKNHHGTCSNPSHMMNYSGSLRFKYTHPQCPLQEQYIAGHELYAYASGSMQCSQLNFKPNHSLYFNSCTSRGMEWQRSSAVPQNKKENHSQNEQRMTYRDHYAQIQPYQNDFAPNIGQYIMKTLSQHDGKTEN